MHGLPRRTSRRIDLAFSFTRPSAQRTSYSDRVGTSSTAMTTSPVSSEAFFAAEFAKIMGGDLRLVKSEEGKGSSFAVTLPLLDK